jgi:hypothetical protein
VLGEKFQERASVVQQALLEDFEVRASEPLRRVTFEIESRESLLLEAKRRAEEGSWDTQARAEVLTQKQSVLSRIRSEILRGGDL